MGASDTISAVRASQEERQRRATAAFVELAAQLADEGSPDPASVEAVLRDAGKSLQDLEAAVVKITERQQLKIVAGDLDAAGEALREVNKQIAEAGSEFLERRKAWDILKADLDTKLEHARNRRKKANEAKLRLATTCNDAELLARRDQLQAQLRELADRRQSLLDKAPRLSDQVENLKRRVGRLEASHDEGHQPRQPRPEETEASKQLELLSADLEKAKSAIVENHSAIENSEAELRAVENQMAG